MTSHAAKDPLVAPLQTSCPLPLLPNLLLGLFILARTAASAECCEVWGLLLNGVVAGETGNGTVQRDKAGVVWYISCCAVSHLQTWGTVSNTGAVSDTVLTPTYTYVHEGEVSGSCIYSFIIHFMSWGPTGGQQTEFSSCQIIVCQLHMMTYQEDMLQLLHCVQTSSP